MNFYKYIFILFFSFNFNITYADSLGRIFTSAEERQKLERTRIEKVEPTKVAEEITIFEEPTEYEKEIINRNEITLKGIVHRTGGKSTAWINNSNTFEGDLESQYIRVPDNKIKSDKVTVIMPDDSTKVDLKVGEAFTPEPLERDIIKESNSDVN